MVKKIVSLSEKISTIYFDLDGPLLDVSQRYYFVHRQICKQIGLKSSLSKSKYWRQKRAKAPLYSILKLRKSDPRIHNFKTKWLQEIEQESVLSLDKVFPFAKEILRQLARKYCLILVTLRRNASTAQREIRHLHLERYFQKTVIVAQEGTQSHNGKYRAIRSLRGFNANALFVGDTEVDILAARKLKIKSVGVLSGIRNKQSLSLGNPDYIVRDVRELISKLKL